MKILLCVLGLLIVISIVGFFWVKRVAQGTNAESVPHGFQQIDVNGLTFSVNIQGKPTDPAVILLHGFPESAVMWSRTIETLVTQGYYVIAPNQRGYSAGARPQEVEDYQLDKLASDVMAIADKLNLVQFQLVGHDWGAGVGWKVADENSSRVISFVSLSVPHIEAFGRAYREDPKQYESSEYIRFFQKSIMPEFALAKDNYERLKAIWNVHQAAEIDSYLELFKQKYALTSAINWYRANFSIFKDGSNVGKIKVPTLMIWGSQDKALKRSGIEMTKDYVEAEYRFVEIEAGHWLMQESYDEVMAELIRHLNQYR